MYNYVKENGYNYAAVKCREVIQGIVTQLDFMSQIVSKV